MPRPKTGKYDELCLYVLDKTKSDAAVLIIVEAHGTNIAISEKFSFLGGAYHLKELPRTLRWIAKELERARK
jgi:hypothetical protein